MGYIPAPARGALHISPTTPAPKDDEAWWDTVTGETQRWDEALAQYVPLGATAAFPNSTYSAGGAADAPSGTFGAGSIGIGRLRWAPGTETIAIGDNASGQSDYGVAVGQNSSIGTAGGIAIGHDAIGGPNAVGIGRSVHAEATNAVVIGYTSEGNQGTYGVAIGSYARVDGNGGTTADRGAVAIGRDTFAEFTGIAIGRAALARYGRNIAIGQDTDANVLTSGTQTPSIAFGYGAQANAIGAIAIGAGATAIANQTVIRNNELKLVHRTTGETSVVMSSADGTLWRLAIDNLGTVTVTAA
jgi:hypothetical protein